MNTSLLLLTFLPSILILIYIIRSDKFPEPISAIIKVFLLGIAICYPASYFNQILIFQQQSFISYDNSFLAGLTEETLKFLVLYFYVMKQGFFDEPMDGIVYGVTVSLGFATLENFEYVINYEHLGSYYVATVRAMTAIPLHAMCGVIMGFYFGIANFHNVGNNLAKALFIPMVSHASYNLIAGYNMFLTLIFIAIIFLYARKLHATFKHLQKNKSMEPERKIDI